MFLNSKVFTVCLSFALIFTASSAAAVFADTIKLKDGSVIKGKIVDFKNQQITVTRTGMNNRTSQITVEADEVESIEFDSIDNLVSLINIARPGAASNGNLNPIENSANNNQSVATLPRPTPFPVSNNSNTVSSRPNVNQQGGQSNGGLSSVINSQPPVVSGNNSRPSASNNRFINLNIKVLADNTANGWTNTGLVVKKGQRLRVNATGRISLGSGKYATPAGIGSLPDNERLMKTEPTGALIAVIGDDNNDFIFIGSNRDFTAPRDGTLFLGVNEGNLEDNSGAFETIVEAEAGSNGDSTAQR